MFYQTVKILKPLLNVVTRNLTGVITRVITNDPVASLTFDDGPDPIYTPKVIDILGKYDARATFFMVGEAACKHPYIVERVARDGHIIGNHSWNHFAFPYISSVERREQLRKCQQAISPYGSLLFRPPYGLNNKMSNIEIILRGYKVIGWSLDSQDWYEPNSESITDKFVKNIKPGSIILLHDRLFDEGKPVKGPKQIQDAVIDRGVMLFALREFLERINGNIQFVTIPELLKHGRPHRETL
ncbi:MAG TPA: polysaccharide deacetylase family protein [Ignavibacteriaceae bacterium]|nr:polysaccharide deacetylase family protein [Ignavibacteriaceae bacterium]